MSKAYDPSARINTSVTKYYVNASGDRWFIPYNDTGTTAAQVVNLWYSASPPAEL